MQARNDIQSTMGKIIDTNLNPAAFAGEQKMREERMPFRIKLVQTENELTYGRRQPEVGGRCKPEAQAADEDLCKKREQRRRQREARSDEQQTAVLHAKIKRDYFKYLRLVHKLYVVCPIDYYGSFNGIFIPPGLGMQFVDGHFYELILPQVAKEKLVLHSAAAAYNMSKNTWRERNREANSLAKLVDDVGGAHRRGHARDRDGCRLAEVPVDYHQELARQIKFRRMCRTRIGTRPIPKGCIGPCSSSTAPRPTGSASIT